MAGDVRGTQVIIRERIVIRIPRMRPAPPPSPTPVLMRWKEKGGPRCVDAKGIAGATIGASDAIDLIMAGAKRMRARLDQTCPSLDFYTGFYIKPNADGKVCATRDAIRSRSGAVCPIRDFRKLVAARWDR